MFKENEQIFFNKIEVKILFVGYFEPKTLVVCEGIGWYNCSM